MADKLNETFYIGAGWSDRAGETESRQKVRKSPNLLKLLNSAKVAKLC